MDKRLFESSEFYQRRYNNFSTMIICPILLLVILAICFGFFTKRELTIKTVGEVQPVKIVTEIQSTSGNEIIENNLRENQFIKDGDILIRYKDNTTQEQIKYLQEQLTECEKQEKQLGILKKAVEYDNSVFSETDNYGYAQILADYFAQRQTLVENKEKENADIANQNETIHATQKAIDDAILQTTDKMTAYSSLAEAIKNNETSFDKENELYPIFASYKQQIDANKEKDNVKNQVLAEIQTTIDQLNETITNYNTQKASTGSFIEQSETLKDQLDSLKAQQLVTINKELITIKQKIGELKSNLTIQQELNQNNIITASESGIIHLKEDVKGKKYITEGTTIAQVYPTILANEPINIVAYVTSRDIGSVHKDDHVRFSTKKENSESFEVSCRITEIDTSPEQTENGSYFKIIAQTNVAKEDQILYRYGLQGTFTIINGKKTYFDYYKDKLLNNK